MKKVEVLLVDDIDGKTRAEETVKFTYRGKTYEIDLNGENLAEFDGCMQRFVTNARGYGAGQNNDSQDKQGIRNWARQQGIKVGSRGRIPATVLREYYKASA
jgi:hypothetical protein